MLHDLFFKKRSRNPESHRGRHATRSTRVCSRQRFLLGTRRSTEPTGPRQKKQKHRREEEEEVCALHVETCRRLCFEELLVACACICLKLGYYQLLCAMCLNSTCRQPSRKKVTDCFAPFKAERFVCFSLPPVFFNIEGRKAIRYFFFGRVVSHFISS